MQANWEVEQKFKVADVQGLRLKLAECGFVRQGSERNSDVYFRHPCRDLKATDEAFRLRTLDDTACLTYKGKRLESAVKSRPEIELSIAHKERDQWLQMLQQLGFDPLPAVVKARETYALDSKHRSSAESALSSSGLHVTIDEVEQLGTYAEIELVVSQPSQLEQAAREIELIAGRLGLSKVEPRSYLSMLLCQLGVE